MKFFYPHKKFYPKATSRIIMITKPTANRWYQCCCVPPRLPRDQFFHNHIKHGACGKRQKIGRTGSIKDAKRIVNTAAIGSTTPDAIPFKNAFGRLIPSLLKGREIMAPSGKFWMAMPMDRLIAPIKVIISLLVSIPAKTTPTAMPSEYCEGSLPGQAWLFFLKKFSVPLLLSLPYANGESPGPLKVKIKHPASVPQPQV